LGKTDLTIHMLARDHSLSLYEHADILGAR